MSWRATPHQDALTFLYVVGWTEMRFSLESKKYKEIKIRQK